VKHRVNLEQEFVIGGYTPGTLGFDSVVIGFHRPARRLPLPSAPNSRQAAVNTCRHDLN